MVDINYNWVNEFIDAINDKYIGRWIDWLIIQKCSLTIAIMNKVCKIYCDFCLKYDAFLS